jgi:prephenate dehydrogenase
MTNREWKHFASGLLDALEWELHPDAPTEDREALRALRSSLERKRITETRKPYERKIDRLVESRPYLFAATHRHIGKILPPAVEQAASTLKKARDLLDRAT